MRLGLLGGTFDPVHYAHLLLAECCREQCRLDQVWFMPAAVPPHKRNRELTSARQRVEMLTLAISGNEAFSVCTLEIERGGLSYTVDTLAQLRAEAPERELFFLLGADSLAELHTWREPERVCQLALPVVVNRPGSESKGLELLASLVSSERLQQILANQVETPSMGLSSTDIRHRIATGRSIRYRTPRAVEKYIETAGLYREDEREVETKAE